MIKIPGKKGASNKNKTLGENPPGKSNPSPSQSHIDPKTLIPFMDRLSVTLKVPEGEDAYMIHSNIWTQKDDSAVFVSARTTGGFRRTWRLKLVSVASSTNWPTFQYSYEGKAATKLRIDFVPADLGQQGLAELHAILTSLIPNGWAYFVEHGRITRVDVAVDIPAACMDDFHCFPKQGATVASWKSDGKLQTFQLGKFNTNHTQIYDRKAKRVAKKSLNGQKGIRFERRLKGQQIPFCDLAALSNPFAPVKLINRCPGPPPQEKRPYVWHLFLNAAEHMTLPAALGLLPPERRTMYRAHLKEQGLDWWDIDAIWANWPTYLDGLKIANVSAWV